MEDKSSSASSIMSSKLGASSTSRLAQYLPNHYVSVFGYIMNIEGQETGGKAHEQLLGRVVTIFCEVSISPKVW